MSESVVDLNKYKLDQIDSELRRKLVEYSERPEIQSQLGEAFYIWRNDPEFTSEDIKEDQIDDLTFEKFFDWFLYDFKLLDSELRVAEKFLEEEGPNLAASERALIKDWVNSVHSFFEVQDVKPEEKCKIKDLFTGKVYEVLDKASSKQIKRNDIIAARPLKIGKEHYFSSIVSLYPSPFKEIISKFFNQELKEYRKLYGKTKSKEKYLKDWGYQIGAYLEETVNNPHFVTPEGHEFVLATSDYNVLDYEKCVKKLVGIKSLKELSDKTEELRVFSWEKAGRNNITATLEIEQNKLHVECYSIDMLAKARAKIEKECGSFIQHIQDSTKELDTFIDRSLDEPKKPKKYPLGVKNKKELDSELDRHYDGWIDSPLEVLGGISPKDALKTNEGKLKLNSVIDELEMIYEHAKKRGEPYYDVSKLRKKLQLI